MEIYGIKVAKDGKSATSGDIRDLNFTSGNATYLVARKLIVTINADPYVIIHGLGYFPKVIVYQILSDHNRKLPYDDGSGAVGFSITKNEVKILGKTSGTFCIYIFAQPIL